MVSDVLTAGTGSAFLATYSSLLIFSKPENEVNNPVKFTLHKS